MSAGFICTQHRQYERHPYTSFMRDLRGLIDPAHTALVTQECQQGAIGAGALWPALADAAAPAIGNIATLATAARSAGVPVFHCLVAKRADLRGSNRNAPLYRAATRAGRLEHGTVATELVPQLAGDERDVVIHRKHGISPLYRTGLDTMLRNRGVRTIVGVGVSVNVAIFALALDAVNGSYDVVIPRDAVAGVPRDYASRVVDNSLSLLATVVTSTDITSVWEEDK
jgi:nicotinamidase-related amidase